MFSPPHSTYPLQPKAFRIFQNKMEPRLSLVAIVEEELRWRKLNNFPVTRPLHLQLKSKRRSTEEKNKNVPVKYADTNELLVCLARITLAR